MVVPLNGHVEIFNSSFVSCLLEPLQKFVFLIMAPLFRVICVFITFTFTSSSDYCAWNRAATPINENNAETLNFINGEFTRDYSYTDTYGDLWQGMPYYKMELESCYVPTLWLYRHIDYSSYPPTNHWVIAASLGTTPSSGYAYCGPSSGVTTDLSSPSGDCDENWMIGIPGENNHEIDEYFKVMVGGCPQIDCATLTFYSDSDSFWTTEGEALFVYESPNIYKLTNSNSQSGFFYLFWNYKMWRWAVNEYIDEYDNCERYKNNKGFPSVADVNVGNATESGVGIGDDGSWAYLTATDTPQSIKCSGTLCLC